MTFRASSQPFIKERLYRSTNSTINEIVDSRFVGRNDVRNSAGRDENPRFIGEVVSEGEAALRSSSLFHQTEVFQLPRSECPRRDSRPARARRAEVKRGQTAAEGKEPIHLAHPCNRWSSGRVDVGLIGYLSLAVGARLSCTDGGCSSQNYFVERSINVSSFPVEVHDESSCLLIGALTFGKDHRVGFRQRLN